MSTKKKKNGYGNAGLHMPKSKRKIVQLQINVLYLWAICNSQGRFKVTNVSLIYNKKIDKGRKYIVR